MNALFAFVLVASVGQGQPAPEPPVVNARDTADLVVLEAEAGRWATAATLARAAVLADPHALFACTAAKPRRKPVTDLIVVNQRRLVRGPLDADMVFLQATLYVMIGDGPSARYAVLLLSELEDDTPETTRLRALLDVPAEPAVRDDPSPVARVTPPARREPVDYNALRGQIGHMSSLLERFSQKLMRRLESRVNPPPPLAAE